MNIESASEIKSLLVVSSPYVIPALLIVCYIIFKLLVNSKRTNSSISAQLSALPEDEYTVLNDIMVKSYTGASQIDHVVVSSHGIFVIEVQNCHGEIVGKDTDQYWTWSTGKEKHRFFNPIRQNHAHIKALEMALNPVGKVPLISIVVFPSDCELASNPLGVLPEDKLLAKIQGYSKNVLTKTQIEVIIATLERANIKSPEERQQYAG